MKYVNVKLVEIGYFDPNNALITEATIINITMRSQPGTSLTSPPKKKLMRAAVIIIVAIVATNAPHPDIPLLLRDPTVSTL